MNRRKLKTSIITLALVVALACSGAVLKTLQIGLVSGRPLANSLVAAGQISREVADKAITDFDDGIKCGIALTDSFNAAKSLPKAEQRPAKFTASQTAFTCFRTIVQRNNFAQHKRFQDAANIAEAALASLVLFYSDSSMARDALSVQPSVTAQSEKELFKKMEAEMKRLEGAMKP